MTLRQALQARSAAVKALQAATPEELPAAKARYRAAMAAVVDIHITRYQEKQNAQ